MPEGEVTMASLIALGASGGLVPCPSALVLLLSSVALGRIALGLALLVAFSLGLAMVLMAIGLVVLYAKHLLPDRARAAQSPLLRYLPVASAGVITCAGLIMTAVALGLVRPFAGA
jgi:ABC-type nickel/cobalt efflux system permease component RcnA